MQLQESIRTSFEEIRAHKLRSFMTLIGIILGTMAMVVVLSVLDGVRAAVLQGFDDLGFDGIVLVAEKEPATPLERAKAHLSRGLRLEDLRYIRNSDNVAVVAPVGENRAVVSSGKVVRRVSVYGITPEFVVAKNRKTSGGRFISNYDMQTTAAVCVLGYKLKTQLFGGEEAVGKSINLGSRRLTVVGVGTEFNDTFVNDDDMRKETGGIYIPFSTYQTLFGRANAISYVLVKARNADDSLALESETAAKFRLAHNGVSDVQVENIAKEILQSRAEVDVILKNWLIVFVSIAGVSLVIGAVGIFSVLKIAISERLFEIGLRKSMGATDGEIFGQFLIESMTLSTLGAGIGCLAGTLLVTAIASNFPAGLSISMSGIVTALSFAIGAGLLAGLYPSLTASRLSPVEALRA